MSRCLLSCQLLIALCLALPARAAQRPAADREISLPSFGTTVIIPEGFVRDTDSAMSVVFLIAPAKAGERPDRILLIDLMNQGQTKLTDVAADATRELGLSPGRKDVKWGGLPAIELIAKEAPKANLGEVRYLLAERDGYIFRLRYATSPQQWQETGPYEKLLESTRWTPFAQIGKSVAARAEAFSLANGVSVAVPDPFRPLLNAKGKSLKTFVAFDLPSKREIARLTLLPIAAEGEPNTMAELQQDLRANLEEAFGVTEPLKWSDDPASPKTPIRFSTSNRQATKSGWVQSTIAIGADGAATVVNLQCADPKLAEGLESALVLIKESIVKHNQPAGKTGAPNATKGK